MCVNNLAQITRVNQRAEDRAIAEMRLPQLAPSVFKNAGPRRRPLHDCSAERGSSSHWHDGCRGQFNIDISVGDYRISAGWRGVLLSLYLSALQGRVWKRD